MSTPRCRALVRALGGAGWLRHCVPAAYGGALAALDSRALCVARETLAYHDGLADFAFAMQGLGSGAITLAGSDAQKARWLPAVAQGTAIAAFALSEPDAGSDVAAMTTRARRDGDDWVLDGCKTWISNGGIADFYCVFARTGDAAGHARDLRVRGPGAGARARDRRAHRGDRAASARAPRACRLPRPGPTPCSARAGEGFKLAMRTLDIFRASVAAAALGSRGGRWTRRSAGRASAGCSARRSPTCS